MKINRAICTLICALIMAASMIGCETPYKSNLPHLDKYQSVIGDVSNNYLSQGIEYDLWPLEIFYKNNMKNKTVSVLGSTFEGEYRSSIVVTLNSFASDKYRCEDGTEFELRDDTGEIVYFGLELENVYKAESKLEDLENPEETRMAIARETAKNFVSDIDEYEMSIETSYTTHDYINGGTMTFGTYRFDKKLYGYTTSDYIEILVSPRGTVTGISIGDIGAFDNIDLDFDMDMLNESVISKTKQSYENSEYNLIDCNIISYRFGVSPNGDVIAVSGVNVTFQHPDSEEIFNSSLCIYTAVGRR